MPLFLPQSGFRRLEPSLLKFLPRFTMGDKCHIPANSDDEGSSTMSRRFLFCAVAAVVLTATLLAGCGGGGGDATYTQGTTWHCLGGLGWDVNTNVSDLDYIAQDAQNALEASTARVAVTITFDRTSSDAERTEAAYKAASLGTPTGDVLIRKGNAVVSWDRAPTGEERDEVDGCLY